MDGPAVGAVGAADVVGVVGAGTMGAGIVQLALEAGHPVRWSDADPGAMERGHARLATGLGRRAAGLGLDADSVDDWVAGRLAGLRLEPSLDGVAQDAALVIEAVVEDLDVKRAVFAALDRATTPAAILATNTSALSIAAIAAATARPGRVLGLHFFNPAPVMPLVELVVAPATDPAVADRAAAIVEGWGRTVVRCADAPGFIVNRVNRPFTIEALRILEAGGADVATIDAAMRDAGFPMGPFELMDLIGVDVNLAAARGVWEGLGRPDRLRPSVIQERLVADGQLGRKTGGGFYRYGDGQRSDVERESLATASVPVAAIRDRILAAIDAEAVLARDAGVATEADIDLALRLGAGHPIGPFERMRATPGTTADPPRGTMEP